MILKAKNGGEELACIQAGVGNGLSTDVPAVSYVAAAIAAAALGLSLVGAAMSGSHPGTSTSSPGFFEVMWWFQGMAMNGMHSVNYPSVYRSFTKNFAFSTGLIPWAGMQHSIDNFRKSTGGNLTHANYDYLQNATLVYPDNSTGSPTGLVKRGLFILARQVETSINGTKNGENRSSGDAKNSEFVQGIQSTVEQLSIPDTNTFMTVLLVFAIVLAAIVVGILLFKVILETWAIWGKFPKSLATFRKEYWRVLGQTIVSVILLLYGVWTLYCIFQFTHGDSWAAKLLAGLTLGVFTAILAFYIWKIYTVVNKLKKNHGSSDQLFEDKETWKKYNLFYGQYKKGYWWLFVPAIVYMFAKGCVLASADGHGLVQTGGQLIIEALMLILLLWSRPYNRKSGNWINIVIQVVRVISVVCILVFVEELGIAQTTKTITGVVLVAVQSSLTLILAILIAVNSIIICCKENPHRKKRKEHTKAMSRDLEGEVFVMQPQSYQNSPPRYSKQMSEGANTYEPMRTAALDRFRQQRRNESEDFLVNSGASMGGSGYQSVPQNHLDGSPPPHQREPTLPQMDLGRRFQS
jgi:Transient receptor potential (TRP) ion channel